MKKIFFVALLILVGCTEEPKGPPVSKVVAGKVVSLVNGFSYFYLVAADGSVLRVEAVEYDLVKEGDTVQSVEWRAKNE